MGKNKCCKSCGTPVNRKDKFCGCCGKPLEQVESKGLVKENIKWIKVLAGIIIIGMIIIMTYHNQNVKDLYFYIR